MPHAPDRLPLASSIATGPVTDRLDCALEAVVRAGDRIMEYFGSGDIGVVQKSDGSPVTKADRAAETLLREAIESAFPDDAILGEEFDDREGTSGYRWVLDPIDGTVSFVYAVPLFGTLVAIEHFEGDTPKTVAGIINCPALKEAVYAIDGGGAWHLRPGIDEPTPARVTMNDDIDEALICTTSVGYYRDDDRAVFNRITEGVRRMRGWSDCYAYLLAATGRADAVVEPYVNAWDIAPMPVIMREAGGLHTDWAGNDTVYSSNSVASNGRIHEELLRIINDGD